MVPPAPKRMMWRVTEAPWRMLQRSGVLTVLDLDEVNVGLCFAEVFRSVLSGLGGCIGGWRCCWGAPCLPQFPPSTPIKPTPLQ